MLIRVMHVFFFFFNKIFLVSHKQNPHHIVTVRCETTRSQKLITTVRLTQWENPLRDININKIIRSTEFRIITLIIRIQVFPSPLSLSLSGSEFGLFLTEKQRIRTAKKALNLRFSNFQRISSGFYFSPSSATVAMPLGFQVYFS